MSDYDGSETTHSAAEHSDGASVNEVEYVNPRGVRFTPQAGTKEGEETGALYQGKWFLLAPFP